jgi:RHS repeat-associated protein
VVAFTYDVKNNLLTATNAKAKTTTFTYDVTGNLKIIQDALGNTTTFAYDSFGELTSKTDARGNTTTFSYDSSGNLSRITDALSHSTTLAYDGIGRLTSITDPNGNTASATYDALSRLVKIADPLAHQTQFVYDAVGNLLRITDANGHSTNYAYDATNNLLSVTDALGHVTQYTYDGNNNRTTFTNAKGNATSYAYDVLNRLSRITDPLSFLTSYSYDSVGNVLAVTDAKGQTNQFTYDALNRLLTITYADGKNVAYSYDANGNRTSMTDVHGTTAYAYDDLDRLTSVTNPGGKVVTYAFDAVGNRKSLSYPDGKVVSYSFDPVNRLFTVTDWLNRITTYSYDAASNLTGTLYPNSAALGFSYDTANRLSQVRNSYRGSAGNPVSSFTYALDPVGNRLQVTDGSGVATSYTYDPLYELHSANRDGKVTNYGYDAVGNRLNLTAPGTTINYSYDADDRLLFAGTASFTYDANGNQLSKTQTATGQPIVYAYDAANRLSSATFGAVTSTFAYDGDGNRISQSVGTGTYNYLNDVATALPVVLQESGPDGNISYAYGLGLISESSSAFNNFYHYDGLGSVVGLTDAAGKLAGRYVYDAWGQPDLSAPGPQLGTKNKFRFTGEALDPGTQLYYLRARYYDPTLGRFMTKDPFMGFDHSPSAHLNRYTYAGGSPVNNFDPSGLSFFGTALNIATDATVAAVASLSLAGTTIVGGYVDTANLIAGGKFDYLANGFEKVKQAEARVLVTSVAATASLAGVKGISLTPQERNSIADQVVGYTNFASDVLGLFVDIPWESSLTSPSAITRSLGIVWTEFNVIDSLNTIVDIRSFAQKDFSLNSDQSKNAVPIQTK